MVLSAVHKQTSKLFAVSLLVVSGPSLGSDSATAKGDLWETTSQMSMAGMPMPMPAQRMTRCLKKEWSEPPGGGPQGDECTTSDFVHEDDMVTWNSVCPDGMSGQGKINFEGDNYSGELRYASGDGEFVIQLTGKRMGECDNPK